MVQARHDPRIGVIFKHVGIRREGMGATATLFVEEDSDAPGINIALI